MKLKLTVVAENTVGKRGLLGEHGLAFWLELGKRHILFDTGQGLVIQKNARELGLNLEQVNAIVLSHGHYDHTGGLKDVLASSSKPTVYAHPGCFAPKYGQNADGSSRYIGMPHLSKTEVCKTAELVLVEKPIELYGNLRLTGPIPRTNSFEDTGGAFYKDEKCQKTDHIPDDQAAYIETGAGTVVLLGCAHSGIINTLKYVQLLTENRPIHAVIGGMHLHQASRERMERTFEQLTRLNVNSLFPCHCTGFYASAALRNVTKNCNVCPVGTVLEFSIGAETVDDSHDGETFSFLPKL